MSINVNNMLISTRIPLVKRDPYLLELKTKNKSRSSITQKKTIDFSENLNFKSIFLKKEYRKLYIDYKKYQHLLDKNRYPSYTSKNRLPNLMYNSHRSQSTDIDNTKIDSAINNNRVSENEEIINNLINKSEIINPRNELLMQVKSKKKLKTLDTNLPPVKKIRKSASMMTKADKLRLIKMRSGVNISKFCFLTLTSNGDNIIQKNINNNNNITSNSISTKNIKNMITNNNSINMINNLNINNDSTGVKPKKQKGKNEIISKFSVNSKLLGKISIFGILTGVGDYGSIIAKVVKKYIIDYLLHSTEIQLCNQRDNYYSIFYKLFESLTKYLKETFKNTDDFQNITKESMNKIDINIDKNGASCILLFFPNEADFSHKCYCVNIGNSKAVLFPDNSRPVPLSYEHTLKSASEKIRIEPNRAKINQMRMDSNSNININSTPNAEYKKNKIEDDDIKFGNFYLTRTIGNFEWENVGVIWQPETIECNLNKEEPKFIIIGNEALWKFVEYDEVYAIVKKNFAINNVVTACKELTDYSRQMWKKHMNNIEEINVIIIFFVKERFKI